MKRAFGQIKKYWLINLITFIISLVVGACIFCLMFFLRDRTLIAAVDGTAVASISVFFIGLLMFVAHLGAFDMFALGFKQLGSMLFAKNPIRDGNFVDYKQEKAEKRSDSSYGFVAVVAAGLVFAIALVILDIVYFISM